MADITFTVPDNISQRVLDAVCYYNGYQNTIDAQPNPQTKLNFFKQKTREYWKACVREYEAQTAMESARVTAVSSVETDINL